MGVVLRARDLMLGRPLAVKVLLSKHADRAEIQQRFLEEAQIMGQLQHPGVPAVHQLGRLPDGRPYFSMKLVRGQTLAQQLRQRTSTADELPRFLGIFSQVCDTVAYAHARGILHRDLKPGNIMVGAFGEVQVMDWGLAKVLGSPRSEGHELASTIATVRTSTEGLSSQAGTVVGTPAYMSSEQARGDVERIDERADVFGLGAILCEVLTGHPPYRGGLIAVVRQAEQADLADAFARLNASGADAELLTLARDCLAGERENRPGDAGVVAVRMTLYQRGVQERLRQAEMAQARAQARAEEERKRRRVQLVLAITLLLALLAGGGGAWLFQQQRQARAAEQASRQQAADSATEQAMTQARLLIDQARAAPQLQLNRFQEALSEAQKAAQLALAGGASSDMQQQASQLAQRIEQEHQAALRDQRLLSTLLEVRGPREGPRFQTAEHGPSLRMAEPSVHEQFAQAFRSWGLDIDTTPTAAAVARLQERPAAVLIEVIAALDEWTSERRQQVPVLRWEHLAVLAEALDNADARRRELRSLLARDWLPRERALGMLSMALQPVPIPWDAGLGQDRGRLRQLAAETDAATEPVLGLLTLVRALGVAGEEALAERLLREALRGRPQEVVLHHSLAQLLTVQSPPRWAEALENYVAARALRPNLGDSLASALLKVGRLHEGLALYERLEAEQPSNPWLLLRHGVALLRLGRYQEAEAAYRQAIRLAPDYADAQQNLVAALFGQRRYEEAETVLRACIPLNPKDPMPHYNLGALLLVMRRFPEAEAACREAIRLKSDEARAHSNLGRALISQCRFAEAAAVYQEAFRLWPERFQLHHHYGEALAKQGQYEAAVAAHRAGLRLKPDLPEAHYNLGHALEGLKQFQEAAAAYREAIRLKGDYAEAHANLGHALNLQRHFPDAEAACRAAIRINPSLPEAHCILANALAHQGRSSEAEASYRDTIRLNADHDEAHYNLGLLLAQLRRFQEAEAEFREALRLTPAKPEMHFSLGRSLQDQHRLPEAAAVYREAIRLKADYAEALNNLANVLGQLGRFQEAEATCREAIKRNAKAHFAYYNLGNALQAQRRLPEAVAAYREALRLQPDHLETRSNLGNALQGQSQFQEAEAAYREVIRRKADFPGAHNSLGLALQAQDRLPEAEAAYREALRLHPLFPEALCNLAGVLRVRGQVVESLDFFRQGHALGSKQPGWRYPSALWLRQAERLVELEVKLPTFLSGDAAPATAFERLELAELCRYKRWHAAAARFAADAFTAEPKFAQNLNGQFRYQAACSAVLAGVGQAEDAGKLTAKDKQALREQALQWLRAELELYAKLSQHDDAKVRQSVQARLARWQSDAALAGVRDTKALDQLSEAERDAWRRLWVDVTSLRREGL
jgi:serine/threonine-protein kinase